MKLSNDPDVELVTYSLGSCIGVCSWDPRTHVGGMLHFQLPDSSVAVPRDHFNPAMFADTGIPLLFRRAYRLGAEKHRLVVKIAGGSTLYQCTDQLNVGKHNYIKLRNIFWKNRILIDGEHTGGAISRTMRLHLADGRVTVENSRMGQIAI